MLQSLPQWCHVFFYLETMCDHRFKIMSAENLLSVPTHAIPNKMQAHQEDRAIKTKALLATLAVWNASCITSKETANNHGVAILLHHMVAQTQLIGEFWNHNQLFWLDRLHLHQSWQPLGLYKKSSASFVCQIETGLHERVDSHSTESAVQTSKADLKEGRASGMFRYTNSYDSGPQG